MFGKFTIALLCCVATGAAATPPKGVCPTGADGNWIIVSVRPDPVEAMSTEEAHAYIGKKVFVSDRKVTYGDTQCEVVKKNEDYGVGGAADVPGFPYGVWYECGSKIFVPGFDVGKSCSHILSGFDGWTFDLRRVKPK